MSKKWNLNSADSFAQAIYFNNKGLMQVHPHFDNVFINIDKKI